MLDNRVSEDSWLLWGSFMVLLMYSGHVLLSFTTFTNTPITVLQLFKLKLTDFGISVITWIIIGFALANGTSKDRSHFGGSDKFATYGLKKDGYALWFYSFTLLTISINIVSTASANREKSRHWWNYVFTAFLYCCFVFPLIYMWCWSPKGWASPYRSLKKDHLLAGCGVLDTAGSSVVYMSGGVAAYIILLFYDDTVTSKRVHDDDSTQSAYKSILHILALFLIVCGSIGFIGVNNIPVDSDMSATGGKRMASTIIAAVCSSFTMLLYHYFIDSEISFSNKCTNYINATIGGLIAISGSCGTCEFEGAFAIGVVAAIVYTCFKSISKLSRLNEKNDVTAVYFANGAWGLLAPGFFASKEGYKSAIATLYESNESRVESCTGVFYGGEGWQLAANIAFLFSVICWSSVVVLFSLFVTSLINGSFSLSSPIHMESIQEEKNRRKEKSLTSNTVSDSNDDVKKNVRKDWDLVIVMPIEPPEPAPLKNSKFMISPSEIITCSDMITKLRTCGLHVYPFYSCQTDEVLLKVSASIRRLKFVADLMKYELLLDEIKIEEESHKNYPNDIDVKIKAFQIADGRDLKVTSISPYKFLYAPFDQEPEKQRLFENAPGCNHPLSSIHRFTILDNIIQRKGQYFANINIVNLLESKCILAYYPLHEKETVRQLQQKWLSLRVMPWRQPIDDVRNYFGETVALYFYFLGHYTTWVAFLSIIGGIVTLHLVINAGINNGSLDKSVTSLYSVPILSFILCIWTHLFLETWKKKESRKALEWGQTNFESTAPARPDFYGQEVSSHINGSPIVIFPTREKVFLTRVSRTTTLMAIMGVIAVVAAIFYYRYWSKYIASDGGTSKTYGDTISGFMNAIQINVLTFLYGSLAYHLNNSENFRTQFDYNDALIGKLFVFNFVNSFVSCFYIAFIKDAIGDKCANDSCLSELSQSLLIIFVSKLLVGNLVSFFSPKLKIYLNEKKETATDNKSKQGTQEMNLSVAEKEFCLLPYEGTMTDFNTLSIQFGYMALFLSALPFAPILATITNFIEIRLNGHKLLAYSRRVIDRGSQDIGAWFDIFRTISDIAVFTNAALIFYTSPIFTEQPATLRMWFGFLFVVVLFLCRHYMGTASTGDYAEEVNVQLQRQEFIIQKIVKREPDSLEETLVDDVVEHQQHEIFKHDLTDS